MLVIIEGLGSFSPNFEKGNTLFGYIGHTAAVLGTNLTTRLQIETKPEDWKVLRFNPGEGIIVVEQVDGEPITPLDDDPEKLEAYFR